MNIKIKHINSVLPVEFIENNGNSGFEITGIVSNESIKVKDIKYSELLPPIIARRLALVVRMGMYSTLQMLNDTNCQIDAIIGATGLGGLKESEYFISILESNKTLSPTPFVQSMHNSMASYIAIHLGCNGYNTTYVDRGLGVENAIIDADMLLEENSNLNILIIGADELTEVYTNIIKSSKFIDFSNSDVKLGEGAVSMIFSSSCNTGDNSIVIRGVEKLMGVNKIELTEGLVLFLKKHNIVLDDIDVVLSGFFSDSHFNKNILIEGISDKPIIHFKKLCGESPTSSVAAIWMAYKKLEVENYKTVLIINQYRNYNYSFILIKKNI